MSQHDTIGTSQDALQRAKTYLRTGQDADSPPMNGRELFELIGIIVGAWSAGVIVGVLLHAVAKAWLP